MARRLLTLLSALLLALALGSPLGVGGRGPSVHQPGQGAEGRRPLDLVPRRQLLPGDDELDRRHHHAEVADAGRARDGAERAGLAGRRRLALLQHLGARSCTSSTAAGTCTTSAGQIIAAYYPTQRSPRAGERRLRPHGAVHLQGTSSTATWMLDPSVLTSTARCTCWAARSTGGTQNLVIAPMSQPVHAQRRRSRRSPARPTTGRRRAARSTRGPRCCSGAARRSSSTPPAAAGPPTTSSASSR